QRLVGVAGDQVDGTEPFVELVGLGFTRDPVENEVRGRHENDLAGVDVKGIFAGAEWAFPDAAFAFLHAFAVAEGGAGNVATRAADIAHDHADVADRHHGLRHFFDRREPAVDKVGAVREGGVLPAAAAPGGQERLGILV